MGRKVINPDFFKNKPAGTAEGAKHEEKPLAMDTVPEAQLPEQEPQEPRTPVPPARREPPAADRAAQPVRSGREVAPSRSGARHRGSAPRQAAARQANAHPAPGRPRQEALQEQSAPEKIMIRMGYKTGVALKEAAAALTEAEQPKLAQAVEKITKDVSRDRFTVAVVGEFGRGKSTLVNRLLGKSVLPTGVLPTTALVTRVKYNAREILAAFDEAGRRMRAVPLSEDAWEGLLEDNFGGESPRGSIELGVPCPWLMRCGIEIVDTPGAGNIGADRTKVIETALQTADAAIITVSANLPLSMSEKLFIEQRLIAGRTPYVMLALTKMDQIPVNRRSEMIEHIRGKLKQWKLEIPVFVPEAMEVTDQSHQAIVGIDKIRRQLESWMYDPERVRRIEMWAAARAVDVLDTGISSLQERLCLLDVGEDKRLALINEKKAKLGRAQDTWADLRSQMLERREKCCAKLRQKVQETVATITERLQFEAGHAANPQKWWKDDYPYRVKIEMGNVANMLNDFTSRMINEDTAWFNRALDKAFKTYVLVNRATVADKSRFMEAAPRQTMEVESLEHKKSAARLAVTALSIAGVVALHAIPGAGAYSIIASTGVSTGGNMLSEYFFKGKAEKQREEMKEVIAREVPQMIHQAVRESEGQVRQIYADIIDEAVDKEKSWMEAQNTSIEASLKPKDTYQREVIAVQLQRLTAARDRLSNNL